SIDLLKESKLVTNPSGSRTGFSSYRETGFSWKRLRWMTRRSSRSTGVVVVEIASCSTDGVGSFFCSLQAESRVAPTSVKRTDLRMITSCEIDRQRCLVKFGWDYSQLNMIAYFSAFVN
ncbi:MAG: hypothetical protein AAB845_02675, partial [Patescibacteria group bacterium]